MDPYVHAEVRGIVHQDAGFPGKQRNKRTGKGNIETGKGIIETEKGSRETGKTRLTYTS